MKPDFPKEPKPSDFNWRPSSLVNQKRDSTLFNVLRCLAGNGDAWRILGYAEYQEFRAQENVTDLCERDFFEQTTEAEHFGECALVASSPHNTRNYCEWHYRECKIIGKPGIQYYDFCCDQTPPKMHPEFQKKIIYLGYGYIFALNGNKQIGAEFNGERHYFYLYK